jgi:voltage-gated potassium channel
VRELQGQDDAWAVQIIDRLVGLCGKHLQALWKVHLTDREAPALRRRLAAGDARLGDLLRDPETREEPLHAVALVVVRDGEAHLAPGDGFLLETGDELLLAGRPSARRALSTILFVDSAFEYVVSGRRVPESWIWRKLSRTPAAEPMSTTPA